MKSKTFLIIFTVAAAMRALLIWQAPLWYDENFTLILARLPFRDMLTATAGDVHPPLWYILEWLLYHGPGGVLDHPAWVTRIPAMLFSLAALYTFRLLLDDLGLPARVQLTAFVLMAVLPMQLWYAQEARMYAMLEFLVLAALLFSLRGKWFALFLSALAMLYTQNYAVFFLASIGIVILVRYRLSPRTYKTAAAMLAAVVLYLPWLNVLASQMADVQSRHWIFDVHPGSLIAILYKLFWVTSVPSEMMVAATFVTLALLVLGLLALLASHHPARWLIVTMAFLPMLLAYAFSLAWHPVMLYRPLIGMSPFLYILTAWNIERLQLPKVTRRELLSACFVLPIFLAGVVGYYRYIPVQKNDGAVSSLNSAVDYMLAHWQDGDVIYVTDDGPMINILPYVDTATHPIYRMPECDGTVGYAPVLGSLSGATRTAIGVPVVDLLDITPRPTRAWVFAPMSSLHPQCYEDDIRPLTWGEPLIVIDDSVYIYSAVWLVTTQ